MELLNIQWENYASLLPAFLLAAVLVLVLLWRPVVGLMKLLARCALGAGVLALLAPLGKLLGVKLGVNCLNALLVGLFGAPGLGLLLLMNWVVC
jgi:hypothetical protein